VNTTGTAHPYHLQDQETFPLNDPNAAWQVQSGLIALCRISHQSGKADGAPQCFFTVHAGEVIFGVEAQDTELVALALRPAVVVPV
jgi:hypothetical protein